MVKYRTESLKPAGVFGMLKIGIVGASGYGGGELLRLLGRHPNARTEVAVSATYAGKPISDAWQGQSKQTELIFAAPDDGRQLETCDLVFLAMDNGKAMVQAPDLLAKGIKVVDLSADFRLLDISLYPEWYNLSHASPQWSQKAIYGLPELFRDQISGAQLTGNPGCYPTAAVLGLAPLLKYDLIQPDSIIVDGASGVSGAGRSKFGLDYHFPELNESFSAYKIAGTHRHTPEIEQTLELLSGKKLKISFTPHLVPMSRGIMTTSYAKLTKDISTSELLAIYEKEYASEPFVVVCKEGTLPATKHALGSNRCHIGLQVDRRTGRAVVISAIDNLMKGMAGQAVQNMNLMCGFEETAGLDDIGGLWP